MAGIIGMGMVWGWLLLLVGDPLARPWRNGLLLTLGSLPVATLVWWFNGRPLLFVIAAVVTFTIHLAWRHRLRQRLNSLPQEG